MSELIAKQQRPYPAVGRKSFTTANEKEKLGKILEQIVPRLSFRHLKREKGEKKNRPECASSQFRCGKSQTSSEINVAYEVLFLNLAGSLQIGETAVVCTKTPESKQGRRVPTSRFRTAITRKTEGAQLLLHALYE